MALKLPDMLDMINTANDFQQKSKGSNEYLNRIDISSLCLGNGSPNNPWILNESILIKAIKLLNDTIKTLWFPTGIYYSSNSIHINFGEIFNNSPNAYSMFREGVKFMGDTNTKIQFATFRNQNKPSFHIEWINLSNNPMTVGVFFWEISNLHIYGDTDYELVRIGSYHPNAMAWNSCVFMNLAINNGYINTGNSNQSQQAIGIIMVRVLQSRLNMISTCAQGIAAIFQNMEFSTLISGSFSNAQPNDHSIYNDSVGLQLIDSVSNTFNSINLEVVFDGIYFITYTHGNVFNTIISNNQDQRGYVIKLFDNKYPNITNIIDFLVIRCAIQCNDTDTTIFPQLWPQNNYSDHIQINRYPPLYG